MFLSIAARIQRRQRRRFENASFRAPKARLLEFRWRRLVHFSLVFAIGWLIALFYHGFVVPVDANRWPANTFLFNPAARYSDLTISWQQGRAANPYINNGTGFVATYFPFAYLAFRPLASLAPTQVVFGYMGVTFVALSGVWAWWLRKQWAFWRGDSRCGMVALLSFCIVMCNYPLLFAIDRANIDPLVMCLVYAGIELARLGLGSTGGLFLAVAAAAKGFPFAALLFWVRRRRFVATTVAVLALIALVLFPAMAFKGDLRHTLIAFRANMQTFRDWYVLGSDSSHYSSDWLNAIRIVARWRGASLEMTSLVTWYERATLVWSALFAFFALFVIRETWRELLAIVLVMLVFPNVANDYKLIFLLPPLLEWLASTSRGWRSSIFGITAGLLLLPKHFYFPQPGDNASISCIINPILILLMSAVLWPTSLELARIKRGLRDVQQRYGALGKRVGSS